MPFDLGNFHAKGFIMIIATNTEELSIITLFSRMVNPSFLFFCIYHLEECGMRNPILLSTMVWMPSTNFF